MGICFLAMQEKSLPVYRFKQAVVHFVSVCFSNYSATPHFFTCLGIS